MTAPMTSLETFWQAFCLAAVQGLTEFLPISSSGHLILMPNLLGWHDQGLAFDIAVHVGTLLAVVAYFRRDLADILLHWINSMRGRPPTSHSRLAWLILFATVITATAGLLFADVVEGALRAPIPIACATIGFGIVLLAADKWGRRNRDLGGDLTKLDARKVLLFGALLGFAQALALIPGASRSGVTISAALFLGMTRTAAARLSFLMAIPIIALAGIWQLRESLTSDVPVDWAVLVFGTAVSVAVAYSCIHWFLHFLQRHGLLVFVVYRIALGGILLWAFG